MTATAIRLLDDSLALYLNNTRDSHLGGLIYNATDDAFFFLNNEGSTWTLYRAPSSLASSSTETSGTGNKASNAGVGERYACIVDDNGTNSRLTVWDCQGSSSVRAATTLNTAAPVSIQQKIGTTGSDSAVVIYHSPGEKIMGTTYSRVSYRTYVPSTDTLGSDTLISGPWTQTGSSLHYVINDNRAPTQMMGDTTQDRALFGVGNNGSGAIYYDASAGTWTNWAQMNGISGAIHNYNGGTEEFFWPSSTSGNVGRYDGWGDTTATNESVSGAAANNDNLIHVDHANDEVYLAQMEGIDAADIQWKKRSTGGTWDSSWTIESVSLTGALSQRTDVSNNARFFTISGSDYLVRTVITNQSSGRGLHLVKISFSAASISGTASITEAVSTINGDGDVDISGTAAVTEAVDAVNGDGGVEISGTAAVSEVTDSVNGDGTVQDSPINGTAAITEAVDAVSATGSVTTNGSAAVAEQSDTVTAVGDVDISGTAAVVENVDTLSATGDVDISGTAAITEAVDVVAAAGGVVISGTSAITEAVDTIVATGNVGVTGTAAITEAVDAVSATGDVDISGTAAVTEASDTVAGVGDVDISGSAAVTEVTDSVNGDGSVGSVANGTAAITEQSDTVAAAGDLPISGTSAITEITDTVAASGSVEISGTATITEATDTVAATGGVEIAGSAAVTEAPNTVSAVGAGEITGRTGTAGSGVSFLDDFTGTNGNPWDITKWPTQDTTGGGVIDIQSNQGRFDFPTNPSRAGAFGSVQVSDFELTLTRVCPTGRADWFVNWRDGGSWFGGTVGGSANVGYTIAFFSFTNGYELRRVDPIEIVVLDTVTSATAWDYTSTDEYSVRIRHIGSDLKVKVWRTLDGEPGAWTSEITDGHYKVGGISLGGGYRSLAGSDRFDNVQVVAYGAAEATDTVAATGGVEIDGSAAVTEASDTVAGVGDIPVSGSAAVTEATDIVVASGAEARTGSAAVTEVTDTVTALGDIPISAAAAVAETIDIIAGAGDIPISGSASIAEVTDSVTATGTAEYNGSAAITEVTDSVAASGTLTTVFTGTANTVENYDTVTASGAVTGDLDIQPHWRWHFVRGNGMLFLTPIRNGHAWSGYDVVSETFRFNSWYHNYANDKVAATWASNKNEPTATLKAAMDAALDAAGFKDIFGGPLV